MEFPGKGQEGHMVQSSQGWLGTVWRAPSGAGPQDSVFQAISTATCADIDPHFISKENHHTGDQGGLRGQFPGLVPDLFSFRFLFHICLLLFVTFCFLKQKQHTRGYVGGPSDAGHTM